MAKAYAEAEPRVGVYMFSMPPVAMGSSYKMYNGRRNIPPTMTPLRMKGRAMLDIAREVEETTFGGTDLAAPMQYAMNNNFDVDAFITFTDNETWMGKEHPSVALQKYRHKSGVNAKMIAVGLTATDYSMADTKDPLSMNVTGFDSAAPSIINNFIRGV